MPDVDGLGQTRSKHDIDLEELKNRGIRPKVFQSSFPIAWA